MGYPVWQIPRESSSRRFPIYISSDPIWTGTPFVDPVTRDAIAFPERIFFSRRDSYNPSQPIDSLRVTGAHEFFHTLQWTYVPNALITWATSEELRWWMEATAQWAQAKVYPQDGSYAASLDTLMREPYRTMPSDRSAYGSFIFATFLEQKVANSETIVRQIWERYRTNNGGNMTTAIEQVLRNQYGTNLPNEFPRFTWHNYFMNSGTYDIQVTGVYTNPTTLPPAFTGPQWQLFRSHLLGDRKNWQAGNAGVLVDRVGQTESYPIEGPAPGKPFLVENLGAAYIEFFPTTLPLNRAADLTITLSLNVYTGGSEPRVSILPIPNFSATPHPPNNFVTPVIIPESTYLIYRYTRTVNNFHQLNRVAVIVSSAGSVSTAHPFSYRAEVILR